MNALYNQNPENAAQEFRLNFENDNDSSFRYDAEKMDNHYLDLGIRDSMESPFIDNIYPS